MNARQARNVERWAAEDAAAKAGHSCLLCGGPAVVMDYSGSEVMDVWDLCASCDGAFQLLAAKVAATAPVVVDGPAAQAVEVLAGQLELSDDEEVDTAWALEVGAVLAAFRTGDWTGVATGTIDHVLRHEADGFRRDELEVMRAILRRRA